MVRVGRARTFGSGGSFFQATVGLRAALNFRRALRQGRFDLLNIHGPADFGLPFWALSMFSGPKVLTLHSCFPDARWRHRIAPYYRWVFRRAAGVIAVSEATAQSMGRYADFESDIIPNGIDVRVLEGRPERPLPAPGNAQPRLSSAGSSSATAPTSRSTPSRASRPRCPTCAC